jgi:hypothetical protein
MKRVPAGNSVAAGSADHQLNAAAYHAARPEQAVTSTLTPVRPGGLTIGVGRIRQRHARREARAQVTEDRRSEPLARQDRRHARRVRADHLGRDPADRVGDLLGDGEERVARNHRLFEIPLVQRRYLRRRAVRPRRVRSPVLEGRRRGGRGLLRADRFGEQLLGVGHRRLGGDHVRIERSPAQHACLSVVDAETRRCPGSANVYRSSCGNCSTASRTGVRC